MKKTKQEIRKGAERILGRQLAREMTPEELDQAHVAMGRPTFTLTFPPDND